MEEFLKHGRCSRRIIGEFFEVPLEEFLEEFRKEIPWVPLFDSLPIKELTFYEIVGNGIQFQVLGVEGKPL